MRLMIGAALGLALVGCTQGDRSPVAEANAWAMASADPVAAPVDCVERVRIRGRAARDDRTIDFTMDDGSLLRNRLPHACPGLARQNRFLYRSSTERLCSTDTITIIEANSQSGASCGLGRFQQISIPPRPAAIR